MLPLPLSYACCPVRGDSCAGGHHELEKSGLPVIPALFAPAHARLLASSIADNRGLFSMGLGPELCLVVLCCAKVITLTMSHQIVAAGYDDSSYFVDMDI